MVKRKCSGTRKKLNYPKKRRTVGGTENHEFATSIGNLFRGRFGDGLTRKLFPQTPKRYRNCVTRFTTSKKKRRYCLDKYLGLKQGQINKTKEAGVKLLKEEIYKARNYSERTILMEQLDNLLDFQNTDGNNQITDGNKNNVFQYVYAQEKNKDNKHLLNTKKRHQKPKDYRTILNRILNDVNESNSFVLPDSVSKKFIDYIADKLMKYPDPVKVIEIVENEITIFINNLSTFYEFINIENSEEAVNDNTRENVENDLRKTISDIFYQTDVDVKKIFGLCHFIVDELMKYSDPISRFNIYRDKIFSFITSLLTLTSSLEISVVAMD